MTVEERNVTHPAGTGATWAVVYGVAQARPRHGADDWKRQVATPKMRVLDAVSRDVDQDTDAGATEVISARSGP
jgi:hypothetical protein